ncbi:C2 domain-containing protein [Suillus clintonianus]|uniref:C2 domain-containing protein n=1 Tax=Suillus clintonianus TaxID=1904413 RepID=UPI001B870604|nr:C2 domain-containing protein [Suillus clintonianus]KAG2155499.1 C2 domain-containing protein [Suillus clintonianus]
MATNAPSNGNGVQQSQETAQTQLHDIMSNDASKGAIVHSFDPDASPQQKAAAAGMQRDQLKSITGQDGSAQGEKELSIDANGGGPVPTITVEDADEATDEEQKKSGSTTPSLPLIPGEYPSGVAPAIPDWYKVGWRAVSNIDAPPLAEGEEKDKHILQLFLSEQYYGQWYHNAALIFFAVFASHFLTRFNFGWGWLIVLLSICNTYYVTSMTRARRCARDDIQRELVKTRLASEHETADWMNNFLDRFWLIYEPVLSATVVASVDQILSTTTPAFLDSLRLTTFTLGTKAPHIDKVRTFPRTPDDIVMMDWGISFTPNDVSDMTPRQAAQKVNPKIVLSVRVGKGLATASIPILLEDITLSGLMRIRLKLMANFPHVQIVDLSFLEKPVIDYVLKPVGGESLGFDIAHIPGLQTFIRDMVHGTLGPMMYDPNVFTLNLEQLLSGVPLDAAIGVVQVIVEAGRGLKANKIGGGSPDPYVSISINNREELARTKYKQSTYNPTWMETKFILVNSIQESLVLSLFDYNDHRKDTPLGAATFELQKLLEDATQEGLELPVLKDGKDRGLIRLSVNYFPCVHDSFKSQYLSFSLDVGIVRLTIHQAKELDATKSLSGDLNPLVKVFVGNSHSYTHKSQIIKHTNNPIWESPTEFICSDKSSSVITIKVVDERDFLRDPVVGHMSVRLVDLLQTDPTMDREWWPLNGCNSGKIRLSCEWKPLQMAGALSGADQYVPPIGVVRLWLQKATDVKNVEATLGGKSDPYVRVLVNNVTLGRTEVINNNLNPEWDQIIYIPVHSLRESMLMEVMDYQHLTKDRSLGSVELHVSDLARESSADSQYRYESTGDREVAEPIKIDGNTSKGHLHFRAEFVSALNLKHVHFDADENEIQKAAHKEVQHNHENDSSGTSNSSSSNEEEDRHVTVNRPMTEAGTPPHQTDSSESVRANGGGAKLDDEASLNEKDSAKEGIDLSKEELFKHQSGIIIFNVIGGHLQKKARLDVLLDDAYWPAFSTLKSQGTNAQWLHVGEGFLKELDFGRVWLRLNESGDPDKDDITAEWKGDAKAFLDATLNRRSSFTLADADGRSSTVEIESRYVPVPVKLLPRESVNNQGTLRVDLLAGKDLRSADRTGKSDPFAVFTLNGTKAFTSQTKKKTLNPDWSEFFEVDVPSREAAEFSVEVFDWNQLEQSKSLGRGTINLRDIEPFEAAEQVIELSSEKHGAKGHVAIRLIFQPEIIAKSRKATSTFSSAGRAMTQIGSLPFGAGKGVVRGIGNVFKRDFGGSHEKLDVPHAVPEVAAGQASRPIGEQTAGEDTTPAPVFPSLSRTPSASGPPSEPGTLRVTMMSAKDVSMAETKPYAVIRVGDKEFKTKHGNKTSSPEWNESFNFAASAHMPKLHLWIYDHKTLGKDKLLAEGEVDIWRHIQVGRSTAAEVTVELQGGGLARLRLEFDAENHPRDASVVSLERSQLQTSPSRFSIRGRRPGLNEDS